MEQIRLTPAKQGLLVAALALVVYLNTLPNAFVIDDRPQILENGFLRLPDGLRRIFTTNVWAFIGSEGSSNYYRPLMLAIWYLAWPLFGVNPAGYHALNIFLHAAVSGLLYLLLRRLQPSATAAWLAALLFAVHPIHVEVVAWISALPDLLCAAFVLLGFWLYLRAEPALGRRRFALEAGVAACMLLALLSKESSIVLLPLLLLYEAGRGRTAPLAEGNFRDRFQQRRSLYTILICSLILYLAVRWYALGHLTLSATRFHVSAVEMIAGSLALLFEYAGRILFPFRLNAFQVIPAPGGLLDLRVLAGLGAGAGLLGLAAWLFARRRPEWLAVPLFLLALAPSFSATLRENGFAPGERYLYLPSAGICWLAAAAMDEAGRRKKWLAAALSLALLAAFAIRVVLRNQDWSDEIGFYDGELPGAENSVQLRQLLSEAYVRKGMPERALPHAQAMVRIAPDDSRSHHTLGVVYAYLGEREKALAEYQAAAGHARRMREPVAAARALNNIGQIQSDLGRPDLAVGIYLDALRLDPEFTEGYNNLGIALLRTGRPEVAAMHLRAAIRLSPAYAPAHANLGLALAALRDLAGARAALNEALRLEPGDAEALARLGVVQMLSGDRGAAQVSFGRALALDPNNARALAGSNALRSQEP